MREDRKRLWLLHRQPWRLTAWLRLKSPELGRLPDQVI